MLIKLKKASLMLIYVLVLAQLGGCVLERRHHRGDDESQRHHDQDQGHANLDINIH
ncbi:MAG: hypothetical protein HQL16_00975 [Candidatus Omnitrophica bacterium]|nr:hypothetical protein [Candidatus Omnitrophota bacterium]